MLPVLASELPAGPDWLYEVKYDGFRAILYIERDFISLISRNGKDLRILFPEIIEFVQQIMPSIQPFLPMTFDGELVSLRSSLRADFQDIQMRGRLKSADRIQQASAGKPCKLLVFDLLLHNGKPLMYDTYSQRKGQLEAFFKELRLPLHPSEEATELIQMVPSYKEPRPLWERIELHGAEGIVAKHRKGKWTAGKRTETWKKVKNYKWSTLFITGYDEKNGYFETGLFKDGQVFSPGSFSHGITGEEREALIQTIKQNAVSYSSQTYKVAPGICVNVKFLSFYKEQLREPSFASFNFKGDPEQCTWEQFQFDAAPIHHEVQLTHPDKPIWNEPGINKLQYVLYLLNIAPYMLPLLRNRTLTLIRYPHGSGGEQFYQKNKPDYAPDFIQSVEADGIDYMRCEFLSDLIWLGNQLALEFHLPFQRISDTNPMEIVFDLDPPSRAEFELAIFAAKQLEKLFKKFNLVSFPKLSGGKGIQIHIPLSGKNLSYSDTRVFTEFFADFLIKQFPEKFTTERLKKNRGASCTWITFSTQRGKPSSPHILQEVLKGRA
nr:DNA ligase D [Metabacillus flavus]